MPEILIEGANGAPRVFNITQERVTIGRARDSDICLPDQWLSRHHAQIVRRESGFFLLDLQSKNGTQLNESLVTGEQQLKGGDVITLGEHRLTYKSETQPPITETVAVPPGTRIFSADELILLSDEPAAGQVEAERYRRLLAIVRDAASELQKYGPLPEILEKIGDLLLDAVPAERSAILLLEGPHGEPVVKAARSRKGEAITRVSRSIARKVIAERVSLLLPNVLEDAAFKAQESILATGIRSALCAPLWYRAPGGEHDAVIGLVYLDTRERSQSFTTDDVHIVTALAQIAAAKIENMRLIEESIEKRRMEADIKMAAEIQQGLLPREAPHIPNFDLVGSMRPCHAVGGDYFDFGVDDGQLLLALGDVSGKGTGAALLMTMLRASVRAHWSEPLLQQAVTRINRTVCQNIPGNKFITFFMARLDPHSGQLRFVNAGHNPPLLVRAGGRVETLTEGGMVLGMFEHAEYADGEAHLDAGDTLVAYSDGVTETWNGNDEEFGEGMLTAVVIRGRGLDARSLETAILSEVDRFAEGGRASDDRTLIILKRV